MDTAGLQEVIETTQKADPGWFSHPIGPQYGDISWRLWDIERIADYVIRSKDHTRELVKHERFPKPIRLPGSARSHALYKAREVIAFVESFGA